MVRVGLVAYVEEQLERDIAQGRLPSGQFGSEEKLARGFGVSRGTVREALRRLAARGLVVQHPGRKTRAVALDESLTLENLGLALHDECCPESRRLLEGYFCLKRQVLVELLADCCASASEACWRQAASNSRAVSRLSSRNPSSNRRLAGSARRSPWSATPRGSSVTASSSGTARVLRPGCCTTRPREASRIIAARVVVRETP